MIDSLKKRYVAKLISSVANGLLGLLVVALVPRVLGPSSYGVFTFLTTFFSNIISFFDTGSSIAFFTKLSKRPMEKTLIGFYLIFMMIIFVFCVFLVYITLVLDFKSVLYGSHEDIYIVAGFLFAFLTWVSQIAIRISDAYALTVKIEIIKILHRIFFFGVVALMIYASVLSLKSFFIYNLISLISFACILFYYFYKKSFFSFSVFIMTKNKLVCYIKEFIQYSYPLVMGTVVSAASMLLSLWLLQKFYGNEEVGYYGFAYQIAAACFVFTVALTPLITREFAVAHQSDDIERMRSLFKRYIPMLYSVAAYFAIFLAFQSENITVFFGGSQYSGATTIVAIMALYPIHQTYGQLSGSVFYATENTALSRNISIVSSAIFLIFGAAMLLPDRYFGLGLGAVGFALAMVATQIIGVNIQLWFNCKYLGLDMRRFLAHQLYSVLFFAILAFLSAFFTFFDAPLLDFLVSGFIYACFATIATYFFPQIFATNRDEIRTNISRFLNYVTKK